MNTNQGVSIVGVFKDYVQPTENESKCQQIHGFRDYLTGDFFKKEKQIILSKLHIQKSSEKVFFITYKQRFRQGLQYFEIISNRNPWIQNLLSNLATKAPSNWILMKNCKVLTIIFLNFRLDMLGGSFCED